MAARIARGRTIAWIAAAAFGLIGRATSVLMLAQMAVVSAITWPPGG